MLLLLHDGQNYTGGPIGRGPVAVGEIAIIGGVLDLAVQRDVFDDFELSHLSLRVLRLESLRLMHERLSLQPHDEPQA